MKILAGIVSYNPDLARLRENILAIAGQVEHTLVIDNASENRENIRKLIAGMEHVSLLSNTENLGMATALNQIFTYAGDRGFEGVLTLDQDSVCRAGLIERYVNCLDETVGMLTCVIKDRNVTFAEFGNESRTEPEEVWRVISSGAFCPVSVFRKVGGFDERLFIDWVDFDFCARVREAGYKLIRVPFFGLLHELGDARAVPLLGRSVVVLREAPLRDYYRTRNMLYVTGQHRGQYPRGFAARAVLRDAVKILLLEDNKRRRICALLRGIRDAGKLRR